MPARKKTSSEPALYEYAVGALGRRMRSVAELKRLLRQRAGSEELIDRVIARLKQQNYLNDATYATIYSGYRRDNEKFGRLRVVNELKARGVKREVIDEAVAASYDATDDEQQARAFLRRKRLREPKNQKEVARVFRALARGGFTRRSIAAILKNWEIDEESLETLENEDESSE